MIDEEQWLIMDGDVKGYLRKYSQKRTDRTRKAVQDNILHLAHSSKQWWIVLFKNRVKLFATRLVEQVDSC